MTDGRLTRIGVFYDGTYFQHASNHYAHEHPVRARLSIDGLHNFVRRRVAEAEGTEERYCRVVDAHYFRGRLPAATADAREVLYGERLFDDVLIRSGVTAHYLPLGARGEKGIDVLLALEAYERVLNRGLSVAVLISGDGDFLPLLRKLHGLGARTMLLAWHLGSDEEGDDPARPSALRRTSRALADEATYHVPMHALIDEAYAANDALLAELFVPRAPAAAVEPRPNASAAPTEGRGPEADEAPEVVSGRRGGTIVGLDEKGFGFIRPHGHVGTAGMGTDVFFFKSELEDTHFSRLQLYEHVTFELGQNERGPCAIRVRAG